MGVWIGSLIKFLNSNPGLVHAAKLQDRVPASWAKPCACVRACVRACARGCVCVCVCVSNMELHVSTPNGLSIADNKNVQSDMEIMILDGWRYTRSEQSVTIIQQPPLSSLNLLHQDLRSTLLPSYYRFQRNSCSYWLFQTCRALSDSRYNNPLFPIWL